jgi:hypothetical protein
VPVETLPEIASAGVTSTSLRVPAGAGVATVGD